MPSLKVTVADDDQLALLVYFLRSLDFVESVENVDIFPETPAPQQPAEEDEKESYEFEGDQEAYEAGELCAPDEVPDWHREILDEAEKDLEENPDDETPWEEVKAKIIARNNISLN
jgi:hypothetical protein